MVKGWGGFCYIYREVKGMGIKVLRRIDAEYAKDQG